MSYIIHVECTSKQARSEVLAFLVTNMRAAHVLWPHVMDERDPTNTMPLPQLGSDLGLRGRAIVGFHYNAGWEPEERNYAYGLVRWIALRVGVRQSFVIDGETLPDLAFYFYEGDRYPLVEAEVHPHVADGWNRQWDVVDRDGFTPSHRIPPENLAKWLAELEGGALDGDSPRDLNGHGPRDPHRDYIRGLHRLGLRTAKSDEVVREELARLSGLWQAHRVGSVGG